MRAKWRQLPRSLYLLYAGTTITRLGSFVFPFLTIYLAEARGFSTATVGLILSVGSLGLLFGNLCGGALVDGWSRKYTLVTALLLNAAGFGAMAASYDSGWPYAIGLFIGYWGSGMYTPAANTLIADHTDVDLRSFAYTVNYVCINLGMALGPLAAGWLAGRSYTWLFLGDVGTSLVCAVLIVFGLQASLRRKADRQRTAGAQHTVGSQQAERESIPGRARKLLSKQPRNLLRVWRSHPLVTAFCIGNFFLIAPLMGLEYSVPLIVKQELGRELSYVGVVYTINAVSILGLSFLIERAVRKRSEPHMMIVAGVFWTLGLAILNFGFSIPALLLCTLVWTVGEIIASILVPSFISKRVAPECKGRFLALNDGMRSLAGVLCPLSLGMLWQGHGVHTVLALLLSLPILGITVYAILAWASSTRRAEFASYSPTSAAGRSSGG